MKRGPKFKFIRSLRDNYLPETDHKDAVFFATDTLEILMNGNCYGSAGGGTVTSVSIEEGNILTVVYAEDQPDYTFDLNSILLYASAMPDDLEVPAAIGGLGAGITAADLKKKTVSEILDDIIFPELQPSVEAPKASIGFPTVSGFSNGGIYEVGANAPQNPTDFTTSFSKGSSKVAGKDTLFRAGDLINDEQTFIYFGGNKTQTSLPEKITLGQMMYNYQAHYAEGPELVTSKGNKASLTPNPLPSGTVTSASISIYGTYPFFCNGAKASSSAQESTLPITTTDQAKLPLQKWTDTLVGAKFASEAATGERMYFDFPAQKKITKVEFMNTVSGKWEVMNTSEYVVTDLEEAKIVQELEVSYKRFTTAESAPKKGALQVRFTIANA